MISGKLAKEHKPKVRGCTERRLALEFGFQWPIVANTGLLRAALAVHSFQELFEIPDLLIGGFFAIF